jgi:hypothetical protein
MPLHAYVCLLKNASDMACQDALEELLLHYRVSDEGAVPEQKD